ncbi:MAG: arginine deiminase family protein [Bacteriovorax sp.]|nr:arginine deiminase family protein [Bacteriovorax sp.]
MKEACRASAYGGPGFIKRKQEPIVINRSEFGKLVSVIIFIPGKEIHQISQPSQVQHLSVINYKVLQNEIKEIKKFFIKNKIQVLEMNSIKKFTSPPNLIFARDLFWNGPKGIILSRMGSMIRASEEKYILKCIIDNNQHLHHVVGSPSTFEGADLLWLTSKELLLGLNNRTNKSALNELQQLLPDIKIHAIPLPKNIQHLLGLIQIIAPQKALIRSQIAPKVLLQILEARKFKLIDIPEIDEVTKLQGMNIVTISPNQIIMPNDCPELQTIYQDNKIKVIKTFKVSELRKAAGGIACATGILKRA